MIFGIGLPFKVVTIILVFIFSMLFGDFRGRAPISIPTTLILALTEFFHADSETKVHPLPVSWYLIASLWMYLCSCMHIMSILLSIAEAVSYGNGLILFKFLTLNVTICIVRLHFSNCCFTLSSVTDFLNTLPLAPTSSVHVPFFYPREKWCGLDKPFESWYFWVMVFFRWLCFYSHL